MPIHPDAIAEARRIVGAPTARTPVAVVQNAWATLKAERGQRVHFERLGDAHHIARPTAVTVTPAAEIDAARARALPRIRAAARALGIQPTGGDAA